MKNKTAVVFLCFCGINFVAHADITNSIYTLAKANLIDLKTVQDIDVVNKRGNTALCQSIIDNEVDTYVRLKQAGANPEHECTKKISEKKYSKFMEKVKEANIPESVSVAKSVSLNKVLLVAVGGVSVGAATGATVAITTAHKDNASAMPVTSTATGSNNVDDIDNNTDNADNNATDNIDIDQSVRVAQDLSAQAEYRYSESDVCPAGYRKGSSYTLLSGETIYKCDSTVPCAYTTTTCGTGYHETGNVCQSGDMTYVECAENSCEGYTESCPDGWSSSDMCISGKTTKYRCDVMADCPYNTTSCNAGYYETGNICKSGNVTYKECAEASCDGFDYTITDSCPRGWEKGSSCLSGSVQKYKCDIATSCDGFDRTSCPNGYVESENCKSGNTTLVKCEINQCAGFTVMVNDECPEGWTKGSSCLSGTEMKYKCDAPVSCDGFTETSCTGGWEETGETCLSGDITYVKCRQITCNTSAYLEWSEAGCVCMQGYGKNSSGDCVAKIADKNGRTIDNTYYTTIYGITNQSNAYGGADGGIGSGTIDISNNSDSDIFGVYGNNGNALYNVSYKSSATERNGHDITGTITINNVKDGTIKAVSSNAKNNANASAFIYSAVSNFVANVAGHINITNFGNGDVFGVVGQYNALVESGARDTQNVGRAILVGDIKINNTGTGDVYGLYNDDDTKDLYNAKTQSNGEYWVGTGTTTGNIYVKNDGPGYAYGMYGNKGLQNAVQPTTNANLVTTTGNINIVNVGVGDAYAMYGNTANPIENKSVGNISSFITVNNVGSGTATGIYSNGGSINNSGVISLNNLSQSGTIIGIQGSGSITNSGNITITNQEFTDFSGTVHALPTEHGGTAYGIYADGGNVYNDGTISIDGMTNGYGIYAKSGASVINGTTGTIEITNTTNAYGIYAENGATVVNNGTIALGEESCVGNACSGDGNYIVLNGGTLENSGQMRAASLNLNSMGGNVIAARGASFNVTNSLRGDLNVSSNLVAGSHNTEYVATSMIYAGDVSELNLRSASVMFDATLADNNHDVVLKMKDFNELTTNKSLAAFLANNYAQGNNVAFFDELKSIGNVVAFNVTLNDLSGATVFNQFAHEDMATMREIGFGINQKMFMNDDKDEYDISGTMNHFSFSNDYGDGFGRYGISNGKISDNWKLGYGLAMANINTGDNDGTSRKNSMGFFYMPITYTGTDVEFISTPKVGFSKSYYTRSGYNNRLYDGYIEKRIIGLMNEARYPIKFGGLTIAPNMAFNTIMYNQNGHEGEQEFSLLIPTDNIFTIEMGLGLYGKYDKMLANGGNLRFNSGLMLYREMADNYNITLGISGLDGAFDLYDDNDYRYRGAATFGVDYTIGALSLYGNAQYFIDNGVYASIKTGFKHKF